MATTSIPFSSSFIPFSVFSSSFLKSKASLGFYLSRSSAAFLCHSPSLQDMPIVQMITAMATRKRHPEFHTVSKVLRSYCNCKNKLGYTRIWKAYTLVLLQHCAGGAPDIMCIEVGNGALLQNICESLIFGVVTTGSLNIKGSLHF